MNGRAKGCKIVLAAIGAMVLWGDSSLVELVAAQSSSTTSAQEFKIGYVNVAKVFDTYQRTQDSDQTLEQKNKQKQGELESRVGELNKLRQSLELLNDQARESKAREIEEKSDEFQQLKTKGQRDLVRERNQVAKEILDEIEQAVTDYAKANKFSVILDQRALVYGQDVYDVTDQILRFLNDRYSARSSKSQKH